MQIATNSGLFHRVNIERRLAVPIHVTSSIPHPTNLVAILFWKAMAQEVIISSLVTPLMHHVVQRLGALLVEDFGIQTQLRREIESIRDDLQTMQAKLLEPGNYPLVEGDSRRLRELSYDIEDLVDARMFYRINGGHETAFKSFISEFKVARKIRKQLNRMKSILKEVSHRHGMHEKRAVGGVVHGKSSPQVVVDPPSPPAFDADASSLVGVDGPREELVKLLIAEELESTSKLKVISIVGIGGMGKTTLAREVYNTTKEYFDCGAWVSVSRNPNMMNILMGILRQVEDPHSSRPDGERDERYLIRKIRESLQHKRYLVVLDDIWDTEAWEITKSALPLSRFGSRVITTTRLNTVASLCCSHWNDHIYSLQPLSQMHSKELFFRRIFRSSDLCPAHLEDISHKIVDKCAGSPLAITTISGTLANREFTRSIWEDLYYSFSAIPESTEGMQNILSLCYYDLPYHLKICLLFLSIFPEDYLINRDLIIRKWIAEGFILETGGKTPEEVGESYLDELINRNMIQPIHGFYDGKPEGYIIHGMILDFIKSKAVEQNFLSIFENEEPVCALHNKIRRLSIINIDEDQDIPASTKTKSHIRALSIFGSVGPNLSFKDLTVLRVFHLEGCKSLKNSIIEEITGLINLRYLSIRETPITELPKEIGKLRLLTTLDLRGTEVKDLPTTVKYLQRLSNLFCDKMRLPECIGEMVALSCLVQFDIFQSNIPAMVELGNLSELRQLVLWWCPDQVSNNTDRYHHFAISLYRLNKLQYLAIHGSDSSVDILDYLHHTLLHLQRIQVNGSCYLNRIPQWFRSLPRLAYLYIDIKEVTNDDLQLLSKLTALIHLFLASKAVPTEKLLIRSSGFPVLQEFHFHSARADLTFESEAMQKLEVLVLSLHVPPEERYEFSIKIDQFTCLRKFDFKINVKGAASTQFFADAGATIRKAADEHPNRPTVNVLMFGNKQGKGNEQKLEPIEDKRSSNEIIGS